jgi:hypothetical protein
VNHTCHLSSSTLKHTSTSEEKNHLAAEKPATSGPQRNF